MGDLDALAANLLHQQIIVNAFACDITRVACLEYGNDQKLMVNAPASFNLPYDDQHGGYIHSGASSNYANLVKFEAYLATQFVSLINAAQGDQGPARLDRSDDAVRQHAHGLGARHGRRRRTTTSSRCASCWRAATAATSRLAAGGRYVKSTERHERILLNICDAFGITQLHRLRRSRPHRREQDAAAEHRRVACRFVTRSHGLGPPPSAC